MQSLQADQSLYNRKGVCCILFNTWSFTGDKNTSILIHEGKNTTKSLILRRKISLIFELDHK
jgi:hypothetical protein